jgi:hypothetical protein
MATSDDNNNVDGNVTMGNEVDDDGDCATGDNNDADDDVDDDDVDDDDDGNGDGAMGSGATGYDEDDDGDE